MVRLTNLPILLVVVVTGCPDGEENEARLFLDRYDAVDVDDLRERRRRVDALRALNIQTEEVRNAQRVCGEMHNSLVEAEEASARARQLLDQLAPEAESETAPEPAAESETESDSSSGDVPRSQGSPERVSTRHSRERGNPVSTPPSTRGQRLGDDEGMAPGESPTQAVESDAEAEARRRQEQVVRGQIQQALDDSANGIAAARTQRPDCERRIAALRARYRSRRRH